jgi:SPP1 family predicted phage head-tail adaptor
MRAGGLNERLTFLGEDSIKTESGASKTVWEPVYTCRARKHKLSTSDRAGINAKEVFTGYNLVFQVRYHPVINDSQRLEYRGELYKIIPPLDYQRDHTYLITAARLDK